MEIEGNDVSKHTVPCLAHNRWHCCYHCMTNNQLLHLSNQLRCSSYPAWCHLQLTCSVTKVETHLSVMFFLLLGTIQNSTPLLFLFHTSLVLCLFLANFKSFEKPKWLYNSLRDTAGYIQRPKSFVLILK